MAKSKEELVRILKSNIKSFNSYREETKLEQLDLTGADLTGTNLCRANLENVILKDAELNFAYLHSAILKNSNLSDLTVGRADMTETDLSNSIISGADLNNTILYGANMTSVIAHNLILEGAKVREVNFANADLTNANLSNLDLNGVNFKKAILNGTDFTSSNLSNALNLDTCTYNETTLWPENSNLPENFVPETGGSTGLPSFEQFTNQLEQESSLNADFGPGVSAEGEQEYEFLDFPGSKGPSSKVPISGSTTEFESHFDSETEDFEDLPSFDQIDMSQFEDSPMDDSDYSEDYSQSEPGLAFDEEPGLMELPEKLEELGDDPFTTSLGGSKLGKLDGLGSIQQQEFPIGVGGAGLAPNPDLVGAASHHQSASPDTTQLQSKVPGFTPEPEPKQEVHVEKQAPSISSDQMNILLNTLNDISKKLENIEMEQKVQRNTIEELKKSFKEKHSSEMVTHKIEDLSAATRSIFSRIESKLDIIAQTDPLDQMDSLLGELADSVRNDQESIETKVMELSTNLESIVSILESESRNKSEIDFTELTNNTHHMLANLESNIREDQDKADKKLDDLATIIEGFSVILENNQGDTNNKVETLNNALNEKLDTTTSEISSKIYAINDTVNNINNTVGTLIELNQDESAESQIYEAFYDFEFRLQIELEKNHSRMSNLEEMLEKTGESLKVLSKNSAQLEKISELSNIPKLLETFRNQLFTEIQQTEQRSNRIKEVVDDMVIQLESVFNMQLENLQRSIGAEIATIYDKIELITEKQTTGLSPEINQKIQSILDVDSTTQNTVSTLNQNLENFQVNIQKSNTHLAEHLNNRINSLSQSVSQDISKLETKVEQVRKESKIDDEVRSIFEHLLSQIGESSTESKETNEKISKKLEDLEMDLQMTLKDMDRRINKINSMIRNVYKALDSVTDLITESSRGATKPGIDKTRKSSLKSRLKDPDLEEDDTE
ncbi:MAG: pentapeptide repeat-containing protein [Cyanobacteriota bacterium]